LALLWHPGLRQHVSIRVTSPGNAESRRGCRWAQIYEYKVFKPVLAIVPENHDTIAYISPCNPAISRTSDTITDAYAVAR